MTSDPEIELEAILAYRFADSVHLRTALTHASLSPKLARAGKDTNERMEFLGDRVLSLVIADLIYHRFPDEDEGRLARRFAALVSGETLAQVAAGLDLGRFLTLSQGEEGSGGRENPALLANACEAVIAAIYLDGGLEPARAFILAHWTSLVDQLVEPPKDNKTTLQEWAQGRGLPLPIYEEVSCDGPAHAPRFTIRVTVQGEEPVEAMGRSKREAQQEAAGKLIKRLVS